MIDTIQGDPFDGFLYWNNRHELLVKWLEKLNELAVYHDLDLDLFEGNHMIAAFDSGITPQDYIINLLFED